MTSQRCLRQRCGSVCMRCLTSSTDRWATARVTRAMILLLCLNNSPLFLFYHRMQVGISLELTDPGFDFTILSDFRQRLVQGNAEQLLLDAMLALFKERGWLKERQRQRTDSTHVLAKIRAINRLMCVGEAMRFALNSLAIVAGDWLLAHCEEEWVYRYGHRIEEARLPPSRTEREHVAEIIGRDGSTLLTALFAPDAPPLLREIPAIEILRQIWVQNY